jgi:uncharacterized protein with HEPN domain
VSEKDERLYLLHISERITRIEDYTKDGHAAFFASPMQQDAVIRNFEVMGEAARRLSEHTRQQHPQIAWGQLIGFRNLLIHGYDQISLQRVWEIIEESLPVLKTQVAALLAQPDEGTDDDND